MSLDPWPNRPSNPDRHTHTCLVGLCFTRLIQRDTYWPGHLQPPQGGRGAGRLQIRGCWIPLIWRWLAESLWPGGRTTKWRQSTVLYLHDYHLCSLGLSVGKSQVCTGGGGDSSTSTCPSLTCLIHLLVVMIKSSVLTFWWTLFSICLTLFIVYSTNMAAEALHCDGTGSNATGLLTLINTTDAFQSSTKTK